MRLFIEILAVLFCCLATTLQLQVQAKRVALPKNNVSNRNVTRKMVEFQLVPDVIDEAPTHFAQVEYKSGVSANNGNILTPTQVKDQPRVTWNAQRNKYYTLVLTDPDAPSRAEPTIREWHHWLVGNIPGNDINRGEVLTAYVGSGPGQGSGLHRYTFLVFEQPGKLTFDESRISNTSAEPRAMFSTRNFAAKYKLGRPYAGNFYQAEWDKYVPTLYQQLGVTA